MNHTDILTHLLNEQDARVETFEQIPNEDNYLFNIGVIRDTSHAAAVIAFHNEYHHAENTVMVRYYLHADCPLTGEINRNEIYQNKPDDMDEDEWLRRCLNETFMNFSGYDELIDEVEWVSHDVLCLTSTYSGGSIARASNEEIYRNAISMLSEWDLTLPEDGELMVDLEEE